MSTLESLPPANSATSAAAGSIVAVLRTVICRKNIKEQIPTNGHYELQPPVGGIEVICLNLVEVTADSQLAAVAIAIQAEEKPLLLRIALLLYF
jgi:hypothetical protein